MISLADYITYQQTGSIDWVNELRQARIEYFNEQAPSVNPSVNQPANHQQANPSVDPRLLRALRGQHYTEANIQRACLRLGLPVAVNLRALRSITVNR